MICGECGNIHESDFETRFYTVQYHNGKDWVTDFAEAESPADIRDSDGWHDVLRASTYAPLIRLSTYKEWMR
jgi:hypothetical protein